MDNRRSSILGRYLDPDAVQGDFSAACQGRSMGGKTDPFFETIENAFVSLTDNPHRGACTRDLSAIGLRESRERRFKPSRIISRVIPEDVDILLLGDERRDRQALHERRLIQPRVLSHQFLSGIVSEASDGSLPMAP